MSIKIVINSCYGGFGLSEKANKWLSEQNVDGNDYTYGVSCYEFEYGDRHDPLLVECVETLGSKASGRFANLEIFEIEGNRYSVSEYDGFESINTPDESTWIEVRGVRPTRIDWLHYCALIHDNEHHNIADELTQLAMLAWDRITDEDVKRFWEAVELAAPIKREEEPKMSLMEPGDSGGLPFKNGDKDK